MTTPEKPWDDLVNEAANQTEPYLEPDPSHTKEQAFQSVLEAIFQGKLEEWGRKVESHIKGVTKP